MKWLVLFLALTPPLQGSTREERALIRHYVHVMPKLQPEYLSEVVRDTKRFARMLCLEGHLDTLLSMAHRESQFDMTLDSRPAEDSFGIYQVRRMYEASLRRFWQKRGVRLGDIEDAETQCAFGVAMFWIKLQKSGGNIWGGVRRYNGRGEQAHAYAKKVFISRRVIFGRPHADGERVPMGCSE